MLAILEKPIEEVAKGYIYALCDPDTGEVRYVGQARDLERRYGAHLREAIKGLSHKNNWIASLLALGTKPDLQVLDCVSVDKLDQAEIQHIAYWKDIQGDRLTNQRAGGGWDRVYSGDARLRMSVAAIGRGTTASQLAGLDIGRRKRFGEKSPVAKLTGEKVLQIRELRAVGVTLQELSNSFAVSEATLRAILSGETWKHVGGPVNTGVDKRRKLTEEEVVLIREKVVAGEYTIDIAAEFGLTGSNVGCIARGQTWKHVGGPMTSKLPHAYWKAHSGNTTHGSDHHNARLDDDRVRLIRQLAKEGRTFTALGKQFSISNVSVSNIVKFKTWRHVKDEEN